MKITRTTQDMGSHRTEHVTHTYPDGTVWEIWRFTYRFGSGTVTSIQAVRQYGWMRHYWSTDPERQERGRENYA